MFIRSKETRPQTEWDLICERIRRAKIGEEISFEISDSFPRNWRYVLANLDCNFELSADPRRCVIVKTEPFEEWMKQVEIF